MKIKTGLDTFLAYILWAVTLALGAWLALRGREVLGTFLGRYFVTEQGQFLRLKQANLLSIVVPVVLWLLWFVMMIVTEEYYRKGLVKHLIWQRFAKVVGILLVLIFTFDFLQNLMLGASTVGWLRWVVTIAELLVGVVLIYVSRKKPASITPGSGGASS